MKTILFTGGGTAGHVTVNMALIPHFIQQGWTVKYMGSKAGIEADLIKKLDKVEYVEVKTGKLRRYWSWENVKDPFRVLKGVMEAYRNIRKMKPNVVFSKGGFVSVPVVLAAWLNKVPVIIHESDMTPGLANKIAIPFASKVCCTFPETLQHLKEEKAVYAGAIVRKELLEGNATKGLLLCDFIKGKPIILVMGGSQGSQRINQAVRRNLATLSKQFQIVHICGKGQLDPDLKLREYKQFEYVHSELADILAMADMVISRAGSNSIFECLRLRKPMLLIPLSLKASRGDQIQNAQSFKKQGYCEVLPEEKLTDASLLSSIQQTYARTNEIIKHMMENNQDDPLENVVNLIGKTAK